MGGPVSRLFLCNASSIQLDPSYVVRGSLPMLGIVRTIDSRCNQVSRAKAKDQSMRFYIVFAATLFLTVCCGAVATFVTINAGGTMSAGAESLLSTASFLFSAGMGAVIGLLAGAQL